VNLPLHKASASQGTYTKQCNGEHAPELFPSLARLSSSRPSIVEHALCREACMRSGPTLYVHINQSDATTNRLEVGHAVLEPVSRFLAYAVVVDELGVIAQLLQVCGTAMDGESDRRWQCRTVKQTHP
jgi:hypothetical protein